MIISNKEWQAFNSFTLAYIAKAYKLPILQTMMTDDWVKSLNLDVFECAKWMMVEGKKLWQKSIGKYDTASLCTHYKVIALMLKKYLVRKMGSSTS